MNRSLGDRNNMLTSAVKKAVCGTAFEEPLKAIYSAIVPQRIGPNEEKTVMVMERILRESSNGVDIGCHKGFFLKHILRLSTRGRHFAFEPIPSLCKRLERRFSTEGVVILPYALSDSVGRAQFHLNVDNPAFSGLLRRTYPSNKDRVKVVEVEVTTLDKVLPVDLRIDFIKMDVEGAELSVLRGGIQTISRYRPAIIFEFGIGSAEYYGASPRLVYEFFENVGYNLWSLGGLLRNATPVTLTEFESIYATNAVYDFVAIHGEHSAADIR